MRLLQHWHDAIHPMSVIVCLPFVVVVGLVSAYSTWLFYSNHRYAAGSAYLLTTIVYASLVILLMTPYILMWLPSEDIRTALAFIRDGLLDNALSVTLVSTALLLFELGGIAEWMQQHKIMPGSEQHDPEVTENDDPEVSERRARFTPPHRHY